MSVTNLVSVQQDMIRYGMTIYYGLGIVGNFFNCIMFTRPTYRHTPSSIYFLFLSIFAVIYLTWAMIPLFHSLNNIDPQIQFLFYCKIRLYFGHILGQCIRFVVVFACIDRYIVTQTNVHIRSLSSVSMALKNVFFAFLVLCIIAIHMPILMDIRNGICGMFGLYKLIYAIYQISLVGILPPTLMIVFSILTMRSLQQRHGRRIRARQRDRYLMRMLTAEVLVNIFTSIPYSVNLVYGAITYYITDKSVVQQEIEAFISFVTQFLGYLISVAPFYLFISISKPFRNEFINLMFKCIHQRTRRHLRVVPTIEQPQQQQHTMTH
ncbi:hypothetical protein I4U23_023465 [Adineta vaga]|nr:hypothetical protein I4U23_023465 [Adineta vaga]